MKNVYEIIIIKLLRARPKTSADLAFFKRKISKELKIKVISNVKLLKAYHDFCQKKRLKTSKIIENLLKKRPIRSLSGVAIVSVLTKPYPCPGKCLYCPTQKGMPKSYLDNEPAVMRAVLNDFDPYRQVENRLKALKMIGHETDKIELIIIGGTWSFLPRKYQEWFVCQCFQACNSCPVSQIPNGQFPISPASDGPAESGTSQRDNQTPKPNSQKTNLKKEQKINEKAKHRIVGITIETRPDFITKKEIINLRKLGVTRVEMGVQSIYNDVLKFNRRGHNVETTIKATALLKNAGFKVCYHLMPNLPGSNTKRDKKMFEEIFDNPDFQPDLLKIYPCAVLKEAPIYNLWKKGKYKPYTKEQLINVLKSAKKNIPYYCRIQRLVRDIPSQSVVIGPAKISNMRQILAKESEKENWKCRCIRCREVKENYNPKEKVFLFRQEYEASGGKEIFLSYENKNRERLYSLLRLRIPSSAFQLAGDPIFRYLPIFPVLRNAAIIREVHTYGQLHPLAKPDRGRASVISPQHKGLGKKLIKEAERIAKIEFGIKKIAVISGVGVKNYYRRLGYKLKDTYMIKSL